MTRRERLLLAWVLLFVGSCGPICVRGGNHYRTRGTYAFDPQTVRIRDNITVADLEPLPAGPARPPILQADGQVIVDIDVKRNTIEMRYELSGHSVVERHEIVSVEEYGFDPPGCPE